ncbi:MAG: hypothetical protein ACLTNH_06110, partial [Enterocloster sp.]
MKVSELANELGKSSKEILDVIKQKDNHGGELYASSSVSKAQEDIVRNSFNPKKEAPKADTSKTETSKGEPAKKKLTAVFRPQNAQQQIKRPAS